jgi:hypothetical protein
MPKEQDEIEEMDVESSTASEDAASDQVEQSTEVEATAESSTATDGTEPPASLSIVRDVVGAEKETTAAAASSTEGEEDTGQGDSGTTPEELPDDYSDVPFHQHPRFQQVIRERNELRGDAVEYRKITAYMDANGLTAEEAANGVTIMGLAKLNPVEAFKQVAPWFKQLAIAAGEVLPDDLAARVQKNELSRDAAFEMSRLRASAKAQEVQQQYRQHRGEMEQRTTAGKALVDAAAAWEQDRSIKDPNFKAKLPLIQKKLEFLHATGQRPNTPEGVKEQLKLVYADVNRELGVKAAVQTRQQQTKKPALTPVRGGAVAGTARPEAPSGSAKTIDVIKNVLGKRA